MNCAVCGSSRSEERYSLIAHFEGEAFPLHSCLECGFMYLKNAPSASSLPAYYQNAGGQTMRGEGSGLFERLRSFALEREAKLFLRYLTPGSLVADLGAGDGSLLRCVTKHGFRGLGVDVYESSHWPNSSIKYKQLDLHGNGFDAEKLRIDGRVPELVIMRHSLEHILEPQQLIKKLADVGVKYLWIIVPNCESLSSRLLGGSWYYWDPPRHLSFFTPTTLERLLSQGGYTHKRASQFFGIDEWVTSLYRYLLICWRTALPSPFIDLFNPKSPLAALSSAVSAVIGTRAAYGVLVELNSSSLSKSVK